MADVPRISLEERDCVICGSSDFAVEARGIDYVYASCPDAFTVVKCLNCGHLYLRPRPTPQSASVIYPASYASFSRRQSQGAWGIGRIKSMVMAGRMKFFRDALGPGSRVLDVGCGDGQLLMDLRKSRADLRLFGLDWKFSSQVREDLQQRGIEVIEGLLEEVDLPGDYFDVVIMNQLIEHLWQPREAMSKVFASTARNGLLSVETVNVAGYDRPWFQRGTWGGYYFPRHMNFFSHQGLGLFLEDIGFRVEKHINLCAPVIWSYSVRAWAMTKGGPLKRMAGFFSDTNPVPLALFTAIDLCAIALGRTTSNQKMLARKP